MISAALVIGCGPAQPGGHEAHSHQYGAAFDTTGSINVAGAIAAIAGKDSLDAKVRGKIVQTCKMEGCWMDIENPNGDPMTIFMKDHAFAIPKEGCAGAYTIADGTLFFDTLSVDYLRHLAEDAGKTAEEIALITEPRPVLAMNADGVFIEFAEGHSHEGHDHEGHDHEGHDH